MSNVAAEGVYDLGQETTIIISHHIQQSIQKWLSAKILNSSYLEINGWRVKYDKYHDI